MKKKFKKVLIIIAIIIILLVGIFVAFKFLGKKPDKPINVIDEISGYSYSLEDRDSQLFKDTFLKLKDVLSAQDIDYEEYAKVLAQLYIIDLYTMDNKVSKYDVGSFEFVYPDYVDSFKLKATETMYKSVENNVNGKRKQELPKVTNVYVTNIEESTFEIGEDEYTSYVIALNWDYKKDLGYDKEAQITAIKSDKYIYIVEQGEIEE